LKSKHEIRRVGLVANPDKPAGAPLIRRAAELAHAAGREFIAEARAAQMADLAGSRCKGVKELAAQTDLILVLGGDGTMLGVSRLLAGANVPILGINIGGLGFLTEVSLTQMEEALASIWRGEYDIDERTLIRAQGSASGNVFDQLALNDFVISRGTASRLIELEVVVDGETLTHYRADGLIICTPTGSTAYSLAAGGAVLSPNTQALTITPVCPHTLSNRSVIVAMDSVIEVKNLSERLEVFLSADGQVQLPLTLDDVVTIQRAQETIRLVRLPGSSFFKTLRNKLNWSGSSLKG
jgi:NAD+ kinase